MNKLGKFAKRFITALYWEFCFEEDDYMERLAVTHFDPSTPDDIVIAELDGFFNPQGRKVYHARRIRLGRDQ